jgi:hypothetical protein
MAVEVQLAGFSRGALILIAFWTNWANELPRAAGNAGPLICKSRGFSIEWGIDINLVFIAHVTSARYLEVKR